MALFFPIKKISGSRILRNHAGRKGFVPNARTILVLFVHSPEPVTHPNTVIQLETNSNPWQPTTEVVTLCLDLDWARRYSKALLLHSGGMFWNTTVKFPTQNGRLRWYAGLQVRIRFFPVRLIPKERSNASPKKGNARLHAEAWQAHRLFRRYMHKAPWNSTHDRHDQHSELSQWCGPLFEARNRNKCMHISMNTRRILCKLIPVHFFGAQQMQYKFWHVLFKKKFLHMLSRKVAYSLYKTKKARM